MASPLEDYFKPGTADGELLARFDPAKRPRHIAVIMDGNGRWAGLRGLSRIEGHKAASESVREVVEASARLGIEVLTLYAFSKENWKRPKDEVNRLWGLLRDYLKKEDRILMENRLRLRIIGEREGIPRLVARELDRVERQTREHERMTVVLALNYGGRAEIVRAAARLLAAGSARPATLDEAAFAARLDTAGLPDPDLLIRTSGELRISNFLLWQCAYAEIWFTPVLWPDFRRRHLLEAIIDYQGRERRFGDIAPPAPRAPTPPAAGADRRRE